MLPNGGVLPNGNVLPNGDVLPNEDVLPNSVKLSKHQLNADPFWLFSCSIHSAGWTALFI